MWTYSSNKYSRNKYQLVLEPKQHLTCSSMLKQPLIMITSSTKGFKFHRGRLMALILSKKPLFFRMGKATNMMTSELDDLKEVGEKALGWKWEKVVNEWDYFCMDKKGVPSAKRLARVVMTIFNKGQLIASKDLAEKLKQGKKDFAGWRELDPAPVVARCTTLAEVHDDMPHPIKIQMVRKERRGGRRGGKERRKERQTEEMNLDTRLVYV